MFEDLRSASADVDWRSASDREVLHAIWVRLEAGDLAATDAWAALSSRYPEDLRFLLFLSFAKWAAVDLRPEALLQYMARLGGDPALRDPVIDLLSLARLALRDEVSGPFGRDFERIAVGYDGARRDENEARGRLVRLERRVLEECHDRTLGNRPLAPKRKASEMRPGDWPVMREKAKDDPETPYSATTRFKEGAKLRHATLGVGFVVARREGKIEVLFESGRRTLVGK